MKIKDGKGFLNNPLIPPLLRGNRRYKIQGYVIILLISILLITCHSSLVTPSDKWAGVDESVVEKVAKEYGREGMEPLINTDQGDLLLFVFLLAGVIGGFICGYYWRVLMEKESGISKEKQVTR